MQVLVLNAGTSSLKFSVLDERSERLLVDGGIDWSERPAHLTLRDASRADARRRVAVHDRTDALPALFRGLGAARNAEDGGPIDVQAVGHRFVHGGERFTDAVMLTPEALEALEGLTELAPLHMPASLEAVRNVRDAMPDVPQFAAFDTAFHASLPEAARTYAIPREWSRRWGLRRYGFHGLSHAYCARRAAEMLGRDDLRVVIAHLGSGASMAAVRGESCVDTSMGFTPLEGLVMATRSGSVDPGLLIYLLREKGVSAEALDHALNAESGLLGVSGISGDMRAVLDACASSADARLAVELYVHRIRASIGAMAATLGGLDAIVFTAGVGERSHEIRRRACDGLEFLGVSIDSGANETRQGDRDIAQRDARVRVLVLQTREDLTILREGRRVVRSSGARGTAPLARTNNH